MAHLVNVSDAASLALHSVVLIASRERMTSAGDIAGQLGASEFHLAKVLQRLAKKGLVRSTRGPRGGFVLAKKSSAMTLLDVYEAIEGPISGKNCLLETRACKKGPCILGECLPAMAALLRNHLRKTRISDLVHIFQPGGKA
jgi:Rrf2 family protein